jgi:BirA family transcriptional regulator, biotin operon repressor / biotin---[acetyl-CoA-carboxylase] ligase
VDQRRQEEYCREMAELSADAIACARRTQRLGQPVIFFERVGSTNDVAHQQALSGSPEGLLVVADEQTAGRGRMGRSWWAPRGSSLLFSLLLRPAIPAAQAGQLTMCLGLGAVEGIEVVTALRPALKWPNDLLLDSRKLGGMLAELHTAGDRVEYAVLGLGLNVNGEFGEDRWTSLSSVLGRAVDRVLLLAEILARCEAWYERLAPAEAEAGSWKLETRSHRAAAGSRDPKAGSWKAGAAEQIHTAWAARVETLGQYVTVSGPAGQLRGKAVGVTPYGSLILEKEDGETFEVWGGDVSVLGVG